jgi:hypothetical protein
LGWRLGRYLLRGLVGLHLFLIGELEASGERQQLRPYQELLSSYSAQIGQLQKLLNSRTMAGALAKMDRSVHGAPAASTTLETVQDERITPED